MHLLTNIDSWKREARSTLEYLKRNRKACKALGRNWRGADAQLLAEAQRCRRIAAKQAPVIRNMAVITDNSTAQGALYARQA